jgi:hypothetical protein
MSFQVGYTALPTQTASSLGYVITQSSSFANEQFQNTLDPTALAPFTLPVGVFLVTVNVQRMIVNGGIGNWEVTLVVLGADSQTTRVTLALPAGTLFYVDPVEGDQYLAGCCATVPVVVPVSVPSNVSVELAFYGTGIPAANNNGTIQCTAVRVA